MPLTIPPLRERTGDILLLAAHFLTRYGAQNKREAMSLSPEAAQKLKAYRWPGNVRELEGVIQRAVILTASPIVRSEDLDLPSSGPQKSCETTFLREAKAQAVRQFERTYLTDLLAEHHGNITRAAKAAGKERRSLQRLLQKHGLNRQSFQA
jgi:DNA-binding NtrC family response regulator